MPLDDGTHEAPALPEIPTVTRTPVVARMPSPKRTGLPPVVRSTVTSDSAQLSSQVLFAQPPPLPNALSASSHLETVPPSSSKRGAVADGHERRAPVFTGDTGSSTHGDDDVLADVEAAAFDASAAAREMHAIENQDVHEGSSQSTDQLVEIDEESTSPQGMISSNKAAQEENYVADDTLVISTSVTANPSLKSTVERAFCDAEVAALSAQACATVASASAHRSAENAYNRTCTFAVDRALSVAEDANSHAYSVSRNALNSSWKTISSKVADEAVATSKHAQDSAQGMAAYDTAQATSAGALPRDTSMISSSQLFTHPEAIEMTPQSRVDSHADAASQEVLEASEVLETVEQDFTSPQALAKSEQFQNLKSTSTGTETVDTASALVVETTAEDTHFPRSAIPLSELPASTSDPPDDSDVNEQESSRLMIKENDYFSKNSNEKSFAIGTRVRKHHQICRLRASKCSQVRVNPIKQNGKVAEVTINGWR